MKDTSGRTQFDPEIILQQVTANSHFNENSYIILSKMVLIRTWDVNDASHISTTKSIH